MTRFTSSVSSRGRLGYQLRFPISGKVVRGAGVAVLLALAIVAGGCSFRPSDTPEAVVEGALRSSARVVVAPAEYRSGLLPQSLADPWIARVEGEYRRWYASPKLDDMITGIHNVVGAALTEPGPIATSVDVTAIDVPSASVNGDEATVENATMSYIVHYAPGTWTDLEVPHSMECWYTLHRTADGWRVTDGPCNVSGG